MARNGGGLQRGIPLCCIRASVQSNYAFNHDRDQFCIDGGYLQATTDHAGRATIGSVTTE